MHGIIFKVCCKEYIPYKSAWTQGDGLDGILNPSEALLQDLLLLIGTQSQSPQALVIHTSDFLNRGALLKNKSLK